MTLPQALSFGIIAATMALFAWGRLRYDLVALLALLAAIATGIVPFDKAFSGFSDDIVIIVACALLVSAAVARSGVVEDALARIGPYLTTRTIQVAVLVGTVTALSAFVKNIGALAMLMPVSIHLARKTSISPSIFLMPMAFGALLGGIVTLVGTSPNVIVARLRTELVGEPFRMFDYTPVGLGLAVAGVIFLTFAWRLIPRGRKGAATMDAAFNLEGYTTEASVPEKSAAAGMKIGDLEALAEEVEVFMIVRGRTRRMAPSDSTVVRAGDILLIEGEPSALDRLIDKAGLKLAREGGERTADTPSDEIGVMEAVVSEDSPLVGRTPMQQKLDQRYGVHLLAVSRAGQRITQRMRSVRLRSGDVIVLRGNLPTLPETLGALRCLPLAARDLRLGRRGRSIVPMSILVLAMAFVAANVVPVQIAFFGAAVAMLLIRALTLREAYEAIDWPILVMLGALIPVSDSLRATGATDLIAGVLSAAAQNLPGIGALALIMLAAMAVTPFLNNAATVLVMAPIAASFAKSLGYSADPFLMAIAIGAACDFLTPVGHQCNTLVMGPGGYRFGDYWRLGLPLSIMVVLAGVPLIALFWPLK
ncbi:MAG TPA: SLC13 family permease [Xanthobacteraceae bacterium]|nr:SLC13 family permease [Xanthobacteraceae bacterium]